VRDPATPEPAAPDPAELFDNAVVTAVHAVPTDPTRVRILVNRKRAAEILLDDAERLAVRAGDAWTPELADRVTQAAAECAAWRVALRLIRVRARSHAEIVRRLRQKAHDPAVASAVADRLVERGLIDDANFAEQAARSVLSRRPAGARFVEAKLRERGLAPDLARAAARDAMADRDPRADAIALAERALRTMPDSLAPEVLRRRVLARLARRGFEPDDAAAALDHVLPRS